MAVTGPGARLRAKREGLGWSVEQVADKLRLDVKYIQALEQDNHADIAAPVFVRGYLRSYATLLQLPADAIVECYAGAGADAALLFEGPAQPPKQRIDAQALRWLVWIVGAAAVVIVVATVVFGGRVQNLLGSKQSHATVTQPVSSAVNRTAAETAKQKGEAQETDMADTRVQPAPEPDVSATTSSVAVLDRAAQTSPESPLTTGTHNKVVLRSSADCWVIISDAAGKELIREHMRAGGVRVLEDVRPPLQVLLGNSPAVTVEYNGKLFDPSRYSRNKVARFTLGADAH